MCTLLILIISVKYMGHNFDWPSLPSEEGETLSSIEQPAAEPKIPDNESPEEKIGRLEKENERLKEGIGWLNNDIEELYKQLDNKDKLGNTLELLENRNNQILVDTAGISLAEMSIGPLESLKNDLAKRRNELKELLEHELALISQGASPSFGAASNLNNFNRFLTRYSATLEELINRHGEEGKPSEDYKTELESVTQDLLSLAQSEEVAKKQKQ